MLQQVTVIKAGPLHG